MLASALIVAGSTPALADEVDLAWELAGFDNPESVRFDAQRNVLYVSNVNGAPTAADGNGYISRVSPDGELLEARWVTGLDAPKGMALVGDRLYVSDIDRLVAIDVEDGHFTALHRVPGAKFLNDVAADDAGRVYVSDMLDDAIYRLDGRVFALWLRDEALDGPNGLLVVGERLLVASWGQPGGDGQPARPGRLNAVDLVERSVTPVSSEGLGHLDGLEVEVELEEEEEETSDGGGSGGDAGATAKAESSDAGGEEGEEGEYLITDWINGGLFEYDEEDDELERLLDLPRGSADIGTIPEAGLVLVPLMNDGKVQAWRLTD
jgi:hypothetical protein